ncbi:MAG: LysE family transporter [Kordiimonadaceae bacterium]|jgi:threonine/homoserine/homoserine lactone efflux protein|nr:LysE family transporter [Kordiimonadaceae bacterium]MBT6030993.1 LysE family transporter [Kordiimonadaceae bacterium]
MSLIYLPWGILIGLIMAAPLGPVNVICLRRAITRGPMNGFVVGLGAAVGDAIFGTMAAFGLVSVTTLLDVFDGWVEIAGGLALVAIGINLWFSHPSFETVKDTYKDRFKAAFGTFLLTITNPMTVLGFVALFVGLGLNELGQNYFNAVIISTGIIIGSVSWWAVLSVGASKLSKKLNNRHLMIINRISAVLIFSFGIVALSKNLFL